MFVCFGFGRSQEKRVPMKFVGRLNRNLNWASTLRKICEVIVVLQLKYDHDDADKFELTGMFNRRRLFELAVELMGVELSELAAWKLVELEPDNSVYYVVLSNIYAGTSKWSDVEKVRMLMKERGLKKDLGSSSLELEPQRVQDLLA
ncbi:hypothetical protein POM88_047390 [Heracleum sosnowskyi]|uniref:Pentatricopeptide repeat-containing protein n=1 Tax=Heracleum sosnowskyi TaxID=360622 RepID=A0AAD8GTT3_9APIA|nr:hypothetical protein POM88_047390 [Heracleum sosnowskyi]